MFSPKAPPMPITATPTSTSTAVQQATPAQLHRLLEAGQAYAATYRGALSNHLPMAQQALLEMGASAQRLQAWTETHEAHLVPRSDARPAPLRLPHDLGRPDSDLAWRAHFAQRIAALGQAAALREALALLMPGVGAISFHGLIRTAHAVLAAHEGELAAGLAHWASNFMPMPSAPGVQAVSLGEGLAALLQLPPPPGLSGGLIAERMPAWAATPGFAEAAARLPTTPDTLRELALLAARTYVATGNFTVLHLLTASHAMTVLEPWWPGSDLPQGFVMAAAAGLLASRAEPAWALDRLPSRPWPDLLSAACAQDDSHVIKLVHAAWRLGRRWPDPAWRRAAERAVPV